MQSTTFEQLQADRTAKVPVVLAKNLRTGAETLLYLQGKKGARGWPHQVAEAARAALLADRSTTIETAEGPVFLNVFNPPLRMIVIGAVHISQSLAPMAALAGYDVSVVDPRRAFATGERFPGVHLSHAWPDEAMAAFAPDLRTAVVTLTHDPKLDDPALAAALRSDAFYIGALGSIRTHARRLDRLRTAGFPEHELSRIQGPAGLDIGARSPAEIAVSILAQATERLRKRAA
ncbi:MAG: XdhC family protein [Alphaproteobacteria bacterium]|nr:XdhC family protein [Alphaproteobacteria bacterium]